MGFGVPPPPQSNFLPAQRRVQDAIPGVRLHVTVKPRRNLRPFWHRQAMRTLRDGWEGGFFRGTDRRSAVGHAIC